MSKWITEMLLHPLFRLFFWLAVSIWLVIVGVYNTGFICWFSYLMAITSLAQVIHNGEKSIAYFREK